MDTGGWQEELLGATARELVGPVATLAEVWARGTEAVPRRLSVQQLRALTVVGREGRTNLTGVADGAGITMSSASRLCDRLVAAGLLARAVPPDNRREIELMLTPRGRRLLDEVEDRRQRELVAVLRAMPAEQVRAL